MRKKTFGCGVVVLMLGVGAAMGQVEVELDLGLASVLLHEPIMARATIRNRRFEPVTVNAPDGRGVQLRFQVEHSKGTMAQGRRQTTPMQTVVVPAGQAKVLEVDLTMHFVMGQAGRYFVRALLKGGGAESRSRLEMIDVVPGLELANAIGAVPHAPGVHRTYSLRYWGRDRKEVVFLCVSDAPSGRVFAPVNLGPLVRVIRPTLTLAEDGTVIVSHQVNRSEMMVSTLHALPNKLTLKSQSPVRIQSAPQPKPATLPPK